MKRPMQDHKDYPRYRPQTITAEERAKMEKAFQRIVDARPKNPVEEADDLSDPVQTS